MGNIQANNGNSGRLNNLGAPKSLQMVTAARKVKDTCSLEEKLWPYQKPQIKDRSNLGVRGKELTRLWQWSNQETKPAWRIKRWQWARKGEPRTWNSSVVKEATCNEETQDTWVRSLGLERLPGEGNSNLLQYSCLGNPMDRGLHSKGLQKSQTQLSD